MSDLEKNDGLFNSPDEGPEDFIDELDSLKELLESDFEAGLPETEEELEKAIAEALKNSRNDVIPVVPQEESKAPTKKRAVARKPVAQKKRDVTATPEKKPAQRAAKKRGAPESQAVQAKVKKQPASKAVPAIGQPKKRATQQAAKKPAPPSSQARKISEEIETKKESAPPLLDEVVDLSLPDELEFTLPEPEVTDKEPAKAEPMIEPTPQPVESQQIEIPTLEPIEPLQVAESVPEPVEIPELKIEVPEPEPVEAPQAEIPTLEPAKTPQLEIPQPESAATPLAEEPKPKPTETVEIAVTEEKIPAETEVIPPLLDEVVFPDEQLPEDDRQGAAMSSDELKIVVEAMIEREIPKIREELRKKLTADMKRLFPDDEND